MVGATLKSDKLLKIAFTQSFLFGHTWHIWLWSGNKSAAAEGSALRVVPHIIPTLLRLLLSSGLACTHTDDLHPQPTAFSVGHLELMVLCSDAWQLSWRSIPEHIFDFKGISGLWGVCRDERSTMMLQACIFSKRKAAHNVWTLNKANKSTDVINYPCLELFRTYASCSMVVHNNQQRSFRFFLTSNISVACVAESLVSVCRCSFY